ncbi:hypothetical protein B0H21DRAFT_822120 [Amylocystis lapponica]|nr:hypothetical protein B0H21DRAFT_822120 [Amylocystis lapponica]
MSTPTPPDMSRTPSYIQFAPKRAMASFENLVALANYEERLLEARKIVWRDRGERPIEIQDIWECFEHAGRGGLRAGSLAFAIRSGVNLILLLTRIKSVPKSYRFALIRHAIFGEDSVRFGTMLGAFVSIYKLVFNALPLLLPEPAHPRSTSSTRSRSLLRSGRSTAAATDSPFHEEDDTIDDIELALPHRRHGSRHARLSMSAQAHQVWLRKRTRRWYSVLAGAVAGGIAITFEKHGRRMTIAQQMFVRGLQGSFNAFSSKHGIQIPHGDVLLFSLCCAQIMYGFILRPDTLPHSYNHWIQTASRMPTESIKDTTPANRAELLSRIAQAAEGSFGLPVAPCAAIHPWSDSCVMTEVDRFLSVFRWMLPIYGALHIIPTLLFRSKRVRAAPLRTLMRASWGSARSSAFLAVFVIIYQSAVCMKSNLYLTLSALRARRARLAALLPRAVVDALVSKPSFWVLGALSGLSLFVEEKRRREELAMYVLPKGLESAWAMARGRGLVFRTGEAGEVLLTAMGMGMVMSTYQNDPQHLSGLVRRILYQFVGPN